MSIYTCQRCGMEIHPSATVDRFGDHEDSGACILALRQQLTASASAREGAEKDAARWAVVRDNWTAVGLETGLVSFYLPGIMGGTVRVSANADATVDEAIRYQRVRGAALASRPADTTGGAG